MRPTIEIQIDRLVLHGAAPGEADRFRAGLTRELGRLARQGLPDGVGSSPIELSTLSITLPADDAADVTDVGARVARSIWSSYGSPDRKD